ncbi:uncharacterized protein [Palaemon carinicauda]|uniref:uncharacterized protein n=1 Tax=Palaemon carinicauda TaxID=392227 RepID=UPI0035B65FDF
MEMYSKLRDLPKLVANLSAVITNLNNAIFTTCKYSVPKHSTLNHSSVKLSALRILKKRDIQKRTRTILNKLINLNGGKLRIPHECQEYINISGYTLTPAQEQILKMGLNCHYVTRPRPTDKRLEVELLLDSILALQDRGTLRTTDALQPLLLAEALTERGHYTSGIVTQDMKAAAKELKQIAGVTVRRADKTAAFVLIDTEEYHKKLDNILADSSKFVRLTRNPIEEIKKEANKTIEAVNAATNAIHLPVISGDFWPGYLYGNVKTHKQGNPLRPIISQYPTPTYQLAKRLNAILTPYITNRYCVASSAEFLDKIKDSTCDGVIASMDVESLFTNVPVDETIDLTADRVYRDDSTPSLNIPEPALRTLLAICTKRALFTTHRGHTYLQKDGVAMGSPLRVLFANFYMGIVEERVFSRVECPFLYF